MEKYNLVKVFEKSILEHWDLPALSDYKGTTLTYGMVGEKIIKLHYCFDHCGLKQGDNVALVAKNSVNWAIAYLATITYGAAIVPILTDFHADTVHHIINHSDAQLLFAGENSWPTIKPDQLEQIKAIVNLSDFNILFEKDEYEIKQRKLLAEEEFFDKSPNGVK